MNSADWELWADVFRAGGREAAVQTAEPPHDAPGFVLARALHTMADRCDRHAADARAVGR